MASSTARLREHGGSGTHNTKGHDNFPVTDPKGMESCDLMGSHHIHKNSKSVKDGCVY